MDKVLVTEKNYIHTRQRNVGTASATEFVNTQRPFMYLINVNGSFKHYSL